MGSTVVPIWMPVHLVIKGNEIEDKCAKETTKRNNINNILYIKMETKHSQTEEKSGKSSGKRREQEGDLQYKGEVVQ